MDKRSSPAPLELFLNPVDWLKKHKKHKYTNIVKRNKLFLFASVKLKLSVAIDITILTCSKHMTLSFCYRNMREKEENGKIKAIIGKVKESDFSGFF